MEPFREYKTQRQSWEPRRRIPVGRSLLVLLLVYAVYASGAVQKAYRYVEKIRELSKENPDPFAKPWREACAAFEGNAFALERGMLVQCSWTVKGASDVANLPDNALFRYAASGIEKFPICVHWIADSLEFGEPKVLGVQSDSSVSWIFHLMLADSSYAWVRSDGCRFPGRVLTILSRERLFRLSRTSISRGGKSACEGSVHGNQGSSGLSDSSGGSGFGYPGFGRLRNPPESRWKRLFACRNCSGFRRTFGKGRNSWQANLWDISLRATAPSSFWKSCATVALSAGMISARILA